MKAGTYVRALQFIDETSALMGNVGPGYFPDVTDRQPLYITHDAGLTWTPVLSSAGPLATVICALDVLKRDGKIIALRAGGALSRRLKTAATIGVLLRSPTIIGGFRIRAFDWAATPLGANGAWSDRLRLMVEQVVTSPLLATLF